MQVALINIVMLLVMVTIFYFLINQNSEYEVITGSVFDKEIEIIKIEREYEPSYSKACLNLKYVYLVNKRTYTNEGFGKLRTYIYCGDYSEAEEISNTYKKGDELFVYYKENNPAISYAITSYNFYNSKFGLIFITFIFLIFSCTLYCTLTGKFEWQPGD